MPTDKFGNRYYDIEFPAIKSAGVFYFNTPSGLRYEVRFGRRQDNILHVNIVFGVINDEFGGEEYVTTNRGEVYSVMSTIAEVVRYFMAEHPAVSTYEFHAVSRDDEDPKHTNARMYLYQRFLPRIFENGWMTDIQGNYAVVKKKNP